MWSRLRTRFLGWFWGIVLRLLAASWKRQFVGLQTLDNLLSEHCPGVIAFWHGKYLPLLVLLRNRDVRVFTTASKRGDVIAVISRHFGYSTTQFPDDAPAHSLRLLRRVLSAAPPGAIAVDGPMGPFHAVKHGMIEAAARLRCPLLAISVAARRTLTRRDRWDKMEVPLPFTRVCIAVGKMISIPADVAAQDVSHWAALLGAELDAATRLAEARVGIHFPGRLQDAEWPVNPQTSRSPENSTP
jgi:lysophospholipid acyltransferase (LPLAT)-like uncharacterized protein